MSEVAQPEKKTVTGVCEEISEKNGWTAFAVNVGSQYPVKLSTKLPAIIEAARAVGGELATWTFNESQGKENPNNPGTFYKNRYLDSVTVGGTTSAGGSAPAPQQRPADSAHVPVSLGDKDRLISRQVCLKAAAALYGGQGTEDWDAPLTVMGAAARFERWLYRDIDPVPLGSGTETPPPSAPPVTPVDPDDEIPFAHLDNYSPVATQMEWSDPWRQAHGG